MLEGTTITTINEQITAINSSITDLQSMDETLDGYIKSLETTAENLQKQINDANAEIAKVESELGEEITALEQSLLDELNSAKEAIQAELSAINKTLDDLKAADVALDKKITDLRTYVDTELASTKDWANATFSTLTQYEQTQTEISTIKASIEQINTDMTALETRLNGKIAADIKTAIDALRIELNADHASRIESAVNNLTVAYTAAVSSARSEITTACTNAIANAIIESESGMKSWVNTKLTQGYYDIATIDGKMSALSARLDETDFDLQKQINEQKTALDVAKEELTMAYRKSIENAINEHSGIISTKIAADISTATKALQQHIDVINSRINSLESRVTTLETNVGGLINRIQEIEVIPSYSDGSVACTIGDNEFYFEVLPSGSASRLAAAGKDVFKLKTVYTQTKAMPSFVNLPISSVRAEGDILVVTASASQLTITAEQSANAVLTVTSGVSSISTGYFPLYFAANSLVVNATLSASTSFSASFTCNLSKIKGITEYGICYSEGSPLCNETKTCNNIDELGAYTVDITSLVPNTTYYYRAYAIIDGLVVYSVLNNFTTDKISADIIHTTEVSEVTAFSAKCVGNVDARLLDYPSLVAGICYSNESSVPTIDDHFSIVSSISQIGVFSSNISGLMPNSLYYCRTYVRLGDNIVYGNILEFTTSTSEDVVFTLSCENISYSTLTLKGKVNIPKDSYSSIGMGFYYSTKNSFDQNTDQVFVSSLALDDTFSADISVFENTQYFYKAFAVVDGTTFYGNVHSITSSEIQVSTNAILDLGLSVKWASSNVGATSPELMGNTYAWGELIANKEVSYLGWDCYKYCMGTEYSITKYNTNSNYGIVDNKTRLENSDDVAYQLSGGTMRIPTKDEMSELYNNCKWIWGAYNGVTGFKIISKIEGYQNVVMFLPAEKSYDYEEDESADAAYWTSDLRYSWAAHRLYISNYHEPDKELDSYDRAYPVHIRAVLIE